jgi:hypothetical protein
MKLFDFSTLLENFQFSFSVRMVYGVFLDNRYEQEIISSEEYLVIYYTQTIKATKTVESLYLLATTT